MREIKFRIWDKMYKKYITLDDYQGQGGVHIENDGVLSLNADYRSMLSMFLQKDTFNVQQFTGLLDKNGKEIYEGDIVKCSIGTKANPLFVNKEISYFEEYGIYGMKGQSSWRLTDSSIPFGKSGSSTSYTPYLLSEFWRRNIEIIGNRFENPELLSN